MCILPRKCSDCCKVTSFGSVVDDNRGHCYQPSEYGQISNDRLPLSSEVREMAIELKTHIPLVDICKAQGSVRFFYILEFKP